MGLVNTPSDPSLRTCLDSDLGLCELRIALRIASIVAHQVLTQSLDQLCKVTLDLPEHVVSKIERMAKEEDLLWPCFGQDLRNTLNGFLGQIVRRRIGLMAGTAASTGNQGHAGFNTGRESLLLAIPYQAWMIRITDARTELGRSLHAAMTVPRSQTAS
jgi:hypothetical protein